MERTIEQIMKERAEQMNQYTYETHDFDAIGGMSSDSTVKKHVRQDQPQQSYQLQQLQQLQQQRQSSEYQRIIQDIHYPVLGKEKFRLYFCGQIIELELDSEFDDLDPPLLKFSNTYDDKIAFDISKYSEGGTNLPEEFPEYLIFTVEIEDKTFTYNIGNKYDICCSSRPYDERFDGIQVKNTRNEQFFLRFGVEEADYFVFYISDPSTRPIIFREGIFKMKYDEYYKLRYKHRLF
jgi:hypothetical protein